MTYFSPFGTWGLRPVTKEDEQQGQALGDNIPPREIRRAYLSPGGHISRQSSRPKMSSQTSLLFLLLLAAASSAVRILDDAGQVVVDEDFSEDDDMVQLAGDGRRMYSGYQLIRAVPQTQKDLDSLDFIKHGTVLCFVALRGTFLAFFLLESSPCCNVYDSVACLLRHFTTEMRNGMVTLSEDGGKRRLRPASTQRCGTDGGTDGGIFIDEQRRQTMRKECNVGTNFLWRQLCNVENKTNCREEEE